MSGDLPLDFTANVYLTVTAPRASPVTLASAHPAVSYVGTVGSLEDVHVVGVAKSQWSGNESDIMGRLKDVAGVVGVEVEQEPRRRAKRGDEL